MIISSDLSYNQLLSEMPEGLEPKIHHLRSEREEPSLCRFVASHLSLTQNYVLGLIKIGAIYCSDQRVNEDIALSANDYVRVQVKPKRFSLPSSPASEWILSQTEDYVAAIKPQWLPTHATVDNVQENLMAFLSKLTGPLKPIQRLDQMTAGVILFAKTAHFQKQFQNWLKRNDVIKIYWATTAHPLPLGEIRHFGFFKSRPPFTLSASRFEGSVDCVLKINKSEPFGHSFYLSEIQLITGRTHQIRAQCAAMQNPLINDRLYGSPTLICPWPSLISAKITIPSPKGPKSIAVSPGLFLPTNPPWLGG